MKGLLLVFAGLFVLFCLFLYLAQAKLIYLPRSYHASQPELPRVEPVAYVLNGKKQVSFLPRRESETPPETVWWLFGGNGSVALDWLGIVEAVPRDKDRAFVLFDYPGYGFSRGRPNPQRIFASVDAAIPAVAEKLGMSRDELLSRSRALGHSLGAAVAFDFANRHGLNRVIAISPFTTMAAMAKKQVGPIGPFLLTHRYDNEKSIDGLLDAGSPVEITIFHGNDDQIIPDEMGRSLEERDPDGDRVRYVPVPEAGHNDIVMRIAPELLRMLAE